ncbi:MAG: type I 3-dehydroquinate dehydratase [Desulfopila sp.]|jgi:3-dehydroquinate dehydratase type I|nr:type I 3-dehydroquinate dehydratase [Desulfopila sp.]
METKICVSIGGKNLHETVTQAVRVGERADVIEIRLDYMDHPVVAPFLAEIDRPLLFTCRAAWEGGLFRGPEADRITLLLQAIEENAAYVDLELLAPAQSWQAVNDAVAAVQKTSSRIICSWHNFIETPGREELYHILEKMRQSGAAIGKIVTMADNFCDVLRILGLQEEAARMNFPLIAFCMGEAGKISRLATTALGGHMTYCSADDGDATAPGQLSVETVRKIFANL